MERPLYSVLARLLVARRRGSAAGEGNPVWFRRHTDSLLQLAKTYLPRGAGIDNGTILDLDKSQPNRLVLHTAFHHMDEHGHYTRWTEHVVTVTPSLAHGFELRISGSDFNGIKEQLHQLFNEALHHNVED